MKKPNILFFFTDDQRHDTIGAMGNREVSTPNLDAFSNDCVAFSQGHIMGGTCGAVCMPSRAMLQTGRNLFSLCGAGRVSGQKIPTEHKSLPEHLRENGYYTHHIGKWHQDSAAFQRAYCNADRIFGLGNKEWYGTLGGHYNPCLIDFDENGNYEEEHCYNLDEHYQKVPAKFGTGRVHSTDIFCDSAVDFLQNYDKDEPFYLYLGTVAPHDPRTAPPEFEEMYNSQSVSTPENFMPRHPFDNGDLYTRDEKLEFFPRTKQAIRRHIADYYGMISHIDSRFGDVVKTLKDKGLYDNTIIIFAGDNGLALGQHGLMGKQSIYEHSVRVPLMIKPVGEYRPHHTEAFAYLQDIFPTLCDLCEIDTPKSVEGLSFAPVISEKVETVRKEMFGAYRNFQRSYKTKEYKIIAYFVNETERYQLFNLQKDPLELEDLAEKAEFSNVLNKMKQKLKEAQLNYNDPLATLPKDVLNLNVW